MVYFFFIVVLLCVCYCIGLFILFLFGVSFKKETPITNPYIEHKKWCIQNDKHYEDHLEWLSKNGGGVPADKIVSYEDYKFEREMKNM